MRDNSSATQRETNQEETLDEQDTTHADVNDQETIVPLRRSTRERRLPMRYRSDEFEMSKSAIPLTQDWKDRINCLTSLAANSPLLENLRSEAGKAILDILTSHPSQTLK